MDKILQNKLLIITGILIAALFCAFPIEQRINLGLDLKGGMHLVLKVDNENLPTEQSKNDAVLRAIEILRNRIDNLGVGETAIQRQGESEILVQLPGVTNREQALQIVGRVAMLEFKLVSDDSEKLKNALAGQIPEGYELKELKKDEGGGMILVES